MTQTQIDMTEEVSKSKSESNATDILTFDLMCLIEQEEEFNEEIEQEERSKRIEIQRDVFLHAHRKEILRIDDENDERFEEWRTKVIQYFVNDPNFTNNFILFTDICENNIDWSQFNYIEIKDRIEKMIYKREKVLRDYGLDIEEGKEKSKFGENYCKIEEYKLNEKKYHCDFIKDIKRIMCQLIDLNNFNQDYWDGYISIQDELTTHTIV